MIKSIFIITIFTFTLNVFASDIIRSYQVKLNDHKISQVAKKFEIVKRLKDSVEVYVLEEKVSEFLSLSPQAKLINQNIHQNFYDKTNDGYRKFKDVERDLISMTKKYPTFLTLETYGQSPEKRNLYALKLNTDVNQGKKEEIMITAATHGDELMPVEVLFRVMDEVFSLYGKDSRVTKMLDNKIIYFIPVVSVDSFEARSRYVGNTDPNRCYPWPDDVNNKPVAVIDSIIKFFHAHDFKATLDLHAYGKLVMYPWGYTKITPKSSRDVSVLNDIVSSMAKENEYEHGQISTTIYVAEGNSADYYYWKKGTRAIAVEIGDTKIPPINLIQDYVNETHELFYKFMEYQY